MNPRDGSLAFVAYDATRGGTSPSVDARHRARAQRMESTRTTTESSSIPPNLAMRTQRRCMQVRSSVARARNRARRPSLNLSEGPLQRTWATRSESRAGFESRAIGRPHMTRATPLIAPLALDPKGLCASISDSYSRRTASEAPLLGRHGVQSLSPRSSPPARRTRSSDPAK